MMIFIPLSTKRTSVLIVNKILAIKYSTDYNVFVHSRTEGGIALESSFEFVQSQLI